MTPSVCLSSTWSPFCNTPWIDLLGTKLDAFILLQKGNAIAQAVSRWLPTAAARVQTRVWSCGIL
jgi:hypothetical protein